MSKPVSIHIRADNTGHLLVFLPAGTQHIAKLRGVTGCHRHQNPECWRIPHRNNTLTILRRLFPNDRLNVDLNRQKDSKPSVLVTKSVETFSTATGVQTPPIAEPSRDILNAVRKRMRLKRYQPDTKKGYLRHIKLSVRLFFLDILRLST